MRLVCPNCEAEYEVDDSLVPPEGRDVQCSNCTTTWFQAGAGVSYETPEAAVEDAPAQADTRLKDAAPADNEETDSDDALMAAASAAAAAVGAEAPKPRKPAVDPEAMKVIHEEVERETAARETERGGIETQPDLGLDDTESEERASAARDRMARRRGIAPTEPEVEDNDEALAAAPKRDDAAAKKELYPDIEEINSTLSPDAAEAEAEAEKQDAEDGNVPAQRARSGFRTGFGLMLLLAVGLLLLYVYAPQISRQMPGLAGSLDTYVGRVDTGRVWLDTFVQGLVDRIGSTLGEQPTQ